MTAPDAMAWVASASPTLVVEQAASKWTPALNWVPIQRDSCEYVAGRCELLDHDVADVDGPDVVGGQARVLECLEDGLSGQFLQRQAGHPFGAQEVSEPRATDPGDRDGVGKAICHVGLPNAARHRYVAGSAHRAQRARTRTESSTRDAMGGRRQWHARACTELAAGCTERANVRSGGSWASPGCWHPDVSARRSRRTAPAIGQAWRERSCTIQTFGSW